MRPKDPALPCTIVTERKVRRMISDPEASLYGQHVEETVVEEIRMPGLSIRDHIAVSIACSIVQGDLAGGVAPYVKTDAIALASYEIADALIRQSEQP